MSSPVLATTTRSSPTTSNMPRASFAPPEPPARTTTVMAVASQFMTAQKVSIREVGPRDGFQNEPEVIPTDVKVELINALARTGLTRMEGTSFVPADVIPQLADAREVLDAADIPEGVSRSVLIPNERGLDHALEQRG